MNKQKKRSISRGKFEWCRNRAVRGMRVNAFDGYDNQLNYGYVSYVTDGFIYWQTLKFVNHKAVLEYFRKSLVEALS